MQEVSLLSDQICKWAPLQEKSLSNCLWMKHL